MNNSNAILESLRRKIVIDESSYKDALRELRNAFKENINLKTVLDRGLCLSKKYKPNVQLLWMGINPSYNEKNKYVKNEPRPQEFAPFYDDFDELLKTGKYYWRTVSKILLGENRDKNLNINKEHLDLFSIRNTNQEFLHIVGKRNLNNDTIEFLVDHIWYTQQFLENYLKPKVIIMANNAGGGYLGLNKDCVWMGYQTKEIITKTEFPGKVYRIIGIRKEKGLVRQYDYKNQLNGTIILHAWHQGYQCKKDKQIKTEHIVELLKIAGINEQ